MSRSTRESTLCVYVTVCARMCVCNPQGLHTHTLISIITTTYKDNIITKRWLRLFKFLFFSAQHPLRFFFFYLTIYVISYFPRCLNNNNNKHWPKRSIFIRINNNDNNYSDDYTNDKLLRIKYREIMKFEFKSHTKFWKWK